MVPRPKRVLVCGGGTGGHVFSGIAIAEAFRARGCDVAFMGTTKGLEVRVVPEHGFRLIRIPILGLKRKNMFARIKGLFLLPLSMLLAFIHFIRLWPDVVIGIGGYASAPGLFWGAVFRRKTALQEQNAIPGITNRYLSYLAGKVFVSFRYSLRFFSHRVEKKTVFMVGNVLRRAIIEETKKPVEKRDGRFTLFIFGGSQGARGINQAVMGMLSKLNPKRFRIFHQTGKMDFESIRAEYARSHFHDADVFAFTNEIYRYYRCSDLVVCRGGALSISEVLAFEKPSIIIPFPGAADDHQRYNAEELVEAGAGKMILQGELSAERLLAEITSISENKALREQMISAAGRIRILGAADRIAAEMI